MAVKSNSQRLMESRKRREEESKNSSSTGISNSDRLRKRKLEQGIGLDTFESDLSNVNTTLSSVLGGWQTQETMANTRSAVENMYKRTSDYQTYVSKFQPDAKTNISEISSYYKQVLDNWDSISGTYGQYKDADSYTKETAKLKELSSMTKDQLASYLDSDNPIAYTTYGGQDITWKSLYDEKEHAELSTSPKGKQGWEKYLADETAKAEEAQKEKEDQTWWEKIGGYLGTTPDTSLPSGTMSQVVNDKRNDTSYMQPTDEWTEEEQNIFGAYYLDDPEKAYDYATNLNNAKNMAKKNEQKQGIADSATSGFWAGAGHTLGSIAVSPLGLVDYLDDLTDMASGRPIIEEGVLTPFEYSQEVQGSISNKLNEMSGTLSEDVPVLGGKGLGDLYGVSTSIGQSALSAYTLGGAGTLISYFGQGASASMDDALARGATDEQALLYGTLVGAGEGLSEMIGVDNLLKMGSANTLKTALKNILKQAGAEGIEEGVSSIISQVADNFVMQDKSVFNNAVRTYMTQGMSEEEATKKAWSDSWNSVAFDTLAGAFSGGVHAGMQTPVKTYMENKATGSAIRENQTTDDLKNLASELGGGSYQKYLELLDSGNISDAKLGKLYNAVEGDARSSYESARSESIMRSVANRANELGDSKNSGIIASAIQKHVDGQKLSEAERTALKSDTAQTILNEGTVIKTSESFDNALKRVGRVKSIITPKTVEEKAVQSATKEARQNALDNQTMVNEMVQAEGREDLSFYTKSMEQAKAEAFNEIYDGKADFESYANSFELAYTYGKNKIGVSEALKNKGVLTEAQALKAYEAGNLGRAIEKQKAVDAINKKYSSNIVKKGTFNDSIIDYNGNTEGKVAWKDLTARQKNAVNFARAFSEVTGVNISFIQSKVVNEETGKRQGENGRYEASTNTIFIDVYAGLNAGVVEDAIVPTVSHEVTHWMKAKAPAMYQKMQDYLLETLTLDGKKTLNDMIAEEKARMKQAHPNQKVTDEDAIDELVARGAEDMLANSDKVRKMLAKMSKTEQNSFIAKVKETFENIMNWVNDLLKQYKSNSKEAELLRQYKERMKELSKMWDATLEEAIKTNQSMQAEGIKNDIELLKKNGVLANEENATVYSVRYLLDEDKKNKVASDLVNVLGVSKDEAMEYLNAETSIASLVLNPKHQEFLDYEADDNEVAIKKNSDYPQGTVDFSNICAKRRDFTSVMNRVMSKFKDHIFLSTDLAKIRTIMSEEKITIPCGICYVEDRRQLDSIVAEDFLMSLDLYRSGSKTRPDGKPFNANQLKALKMVENDKYTPSIYELITLEGRNELKAKDSNMENAWVTYNNARGMQSVRLLTNEAEYKREILNYSPAEVKRKNDFGGLRIYSFSDAEIPHLIDLVQVITDSASKGLSIQGYTKVNWYAKMVKDTGVKLNRSLIPAGDLGYVIEDGKVILDYDTVEGIDINDKDFFDSTDYDNVGNILIGINEVQIRTAMLDTFVDYIIPFHTGQSGDVLKEKGIGKWQNYKDFQSERNISDGKKSAKQINIYTDVIQRLEAEGTPLKNKVQFVEKFLSVCKENGLIPRFSEFLNTDENGDYIYTEGYHKFIIDFKTFHSVTGEYLPQMPVKPIFDNEFITQTLTKFAKQEKSKQAELAPKMEKAVARIEEEVIGTQYSDRDYLDAVNRGDMETAQKMVDEVAKAHGYTTKAYHGTASDFTVFKNAKKLNNYGGYAEFGRGFYFTKDESYAKYFSKNAEKHLNRKGKSEAKAKTMEVYLDLGNTLNADETVKDGRLLDYLLPTMNKDEYKNRTVARVIGWMKDQERQGKLKVSKVLSELGYDSLSSEEQDQYVVFNPNQIKSAEPVTYDDHGNVIPLSERFNDANEDIRYSDRDYTSVYELMGEKDTLDEENRKLKADIEKLKVTIGSEDVKNTRFRSLADYLKKQAGSNYNREALGDALKELYAYIQTTDDLKWYNVMAKAEEIANDMMQLNVPVNYFREVMFDIRQDKVSLSEEQYAEAVKLYGSYGNLHKALFGSINLTKSGKPLEEQWKDWAKAFPTVFKVDISATDMVKELRDIVDALKSTSAVMGEYERQEAIRHMGMEIYNQFWNIASDSSDAVRKEKASHRQMMEEMRQDYQKRQAEKTLHPTGELALKYEKLLKDTIKKDRAEMKRIRELGKERMDKYKERAEANATIQKITKNALTLNEWFVKNNKDKHIPEDMKDAVVQLISAIDFSSKQLLGRGPNAYQPTQKDLRLSKALSNLYKVANNMKAQRAEAVSNESVYMDIDIPDFVVEDLEKLAEIADGLAEKYGNERFVLNDMSLEQLKCLNDVIATLKTAISTANKTFVMGQNESRSRVANELIAYADKLSEKKADNLATNFLEYQNTTPYYMLKRLGPVGERIFNVLMDAQEDLVFMEEEIINFVDSILDGKKIKEWSEEIHEFEVLDTKHSTADDPKYKTIKMTTAQIMSAYCLNKRESAKLHLDGGGIRITDIKESEFKKIKDTEGSALSRSELDTILNTLTDDQRRVADALQKYMSEKGAEWGNKVTMARWGIKQFGEENYFPMDTVAQDGNLDNIGQKDNSIYRLLNMSFTKSLTPNANNQLVIDNIFDVFTRHMTDMAKYSSHALPLLDAMKILGYSYKQYLDEEKVRHNTISVAQSVRRAFGDNGYRYIVNLLKDLNGAEVTPRDETIPKKLMSNYKISAVGGNLRVALLQGSAYVKAGLVLNPKYLAKVNPLKSLDGINKAMKYSGIALWKSKGHYDMNISRSVAEEIKQDKNWTNKIREWSLKGAEWGDKLTWGMLWNACESWAKDNTPYSYNSAEFNQAVADKLREIIVKTQVVDSTLTRSQMMRSKSAMVQTLTAFMSESTMTYNMVSDAFFEWSLDARKEGHSYKNTFSKHGRKFATTVSVFTLTAFTTALAGGFVDAVRDDDEDEEFDEKYLQHFLESLGDSLNFFTSLPIVKDIVSIAQGYSPSRFDEQSFVNLFSGMRQWMKVAEGDGNVYKATYKTLQGMSQLTGLPVSNAMRDVVAMWNSTIGEMYTHLKIEQ